jgi:hypothetical protein
MLRVSIPKEIFSHIYIFKSLEELSNALDEIKKNEKDINLIAMVA